MQANLAKLDISHLNLSEPRPKEVCQEGCNTYRQFITCNGQKLVIQTPDFEEDRLYSRSKNDLRSLNIPVSAWVREQLNLLEKFVEENVTIPEDVKKALGEPKYKELWDRERMYIGASNWCKYYRCEGNSFDAKPVSPDSWFGHGTYKFYIEVPYVYIGPHKNGSSFSLTLRIVEVIHKPSPLNSGEVVCGCPLNQHAHPTEMEEPKAKKSKRPRKTKKEKKEKKEENAMDFLESLVADTNF